MVLVIFTTVVLGTLAVLQYAVEHPRVHAPTWTSSRPPYPGLESFTEEDAPVFFGRDQEIEQLLDNVIQRCAEPPDRRGTRSVRMW